MADLEQAKENPRGQLWEELEDIPAGMLGLAGSDQHMQPMAPQIDRAQNRILFFTKRDSDLVKSMHGNQTAKFTFIGEDHDYHACIHGALRVNTDRSIIEQHWNPVVDAWYDEGKDDPNLVLLEFKPDEAAVWASTDSSLKFGWEIAKAKFGNSEPDVGVRTHVTF
ncbi:MAG: pyridoxamine 5'-phosphate oxidase family protein [Pseudomonadota bacterium]